MNGNGTRSATITAACAAILVAGGCAGSGDAPSSEPDRDAFDELRAGVVDVVDDPQREAEALRQLDALFAELREVENAIVDRRNRLRRLNADYDTPREDFEALIDEVQADLRARRASAGEIHRKLLATLTADELDAIMKLKSKAVSASLNELQSI